MKNCIALGCNELIGEEDLYCSSHLKAISRRRRKLNEPEVKAYLECKSYQRYIKAWEENKNEDLRCFKCREKKAQALHYISCVKGSLDQKLMLLCHGCHSGFH